MSGGRPSIKVMFPSGMLGSGFSEASVLRGLALGADAIAIDAGSTDSGPYYLGAGVSKNSPTAVRRDLRVLVRASQEAGIPLVVGSCATSGTNAGVDLVTQLAAEIAAEGRLSFRLARIYSEQSKDSLVTLLSAGKIAPLPPTGELDEETLQSCEHIVALMGHEPIVAALEEGADVVLAGRSSDTSLVAALALRAGLPAGPSWHAAKTVECGDLCAENPRGEGVLVEIDASGFTVTPLALDAACTPGSVAAHMLYENVNPFRLTEPSGVLDTSDAQYEAVDRRSVRVTGSRFEPTSQPTVKLEGSALAGYETMSLVGIADPVVLRSIHSWTDEFQTRLDARVRTLLELEPDSYAVDLRLLGQDAVLGPLTTAEGPAREVCVLLKVRAADQDTATAIAKTANPLLLHLPSREMTTMPSYAFITSPAEFERGPSYEFRLNHVVAVDDPCELFQTQLSDV
jgi:Acyclic terpene utilisation family protein AtuA